MGNQIVWGGCGLRTVSKKSPAVLARELGKQQAGAPSFGGGGKGEERRQNATTHRREEKRNKRLILEGSQDFASLLQKEEKVFPSPNGELPRPRGGGTT